MPDIPSLLPQLQRNPARPAILSSAALLRLGIKDNGPSPGSGGGKNGVGREWHLRDEDWAGNGIYLEGVREEGRLLILYRNPELLTQNTKCWIINCGNAFRSNEIIPCIHTQRVVPDVGERAAILCTVGEARRRVGFARGEGQGIGKGAGAVCKGCNPQDLEVELWDYEATSLSRGQEVG